MESALKWALVQIISTALFTITAKLALDSGSDVLAYSSMVLITSGFMLLGYILFKDKSLLEIHGKKQWVYIILIGLIVGAVSYPLALFGLKNSSAINYAFLIQTSVIFTAVLSHFFLKERFGHRKKAILFLLLVGCYLLTTGGKSFEPKTADLIIIASAIVFSAIVILTKFALKELDPTTVAFYRIKIGGVLVMLFSVFVLGTKSSASIPLVFLGAFFITTGTVAMNQVLKAREASYMNMMYLSIPVLSVALAFIMLNEEINRFQIVGGAIVLFANYLLNKV